MISALKSQNRVGNHTRNPRCLHVPCGLSPEGVASQRIQASAREPRLRDRAAGSVQRLCGVWRSGPRPLPVLTRHILAYLMPLAMPSLC